MNKPDNKNLLWKYAGLATQFLIGIGLFLFIGLKIDKWLKLNTPVAVWVLPSLFIAAVMIKIIKDTAQKK
ncbi:MAG: hypothetical protein H7258_08310 [Ferruginibacter sp.]|nr:hypothetical protein [Ferruginibacter sp.]